MKQWKCGMYLYLTASSPPQHTSALQHTLYTLAHTSVCHKVHVADVCVFAVPDVLPRSYTLPLYFTPEDMEHLSGTAAISENSHLHHHSFFVINHFVCSLFEYTLLSRFFHQSKPSVLTRSALLSVSMPTCTAS